MSAASRVVGKVQGDTELQHFTDFQALPAALKHVGDKTGAFTAFETYEPGFQARKEFHRCIIVLKESRVRWVKRRQATAMALITY